MAQMVFLIENPPVGEYYRAGAAWRLEPSGIILGEEVPMRGKRRLVACSLLTMVAAVYTSSPSRYPITAAAMQEVLRGELTAQARYLAYADKAREEKFPGLADFAFALSESEAIHAINFKKVLTDLGVAPDLSIPRFAVGDSRANLKDASTTEMVEIDSLYPRYLERIGPEGLRPALDALNHAWQSEKLHKDLIAQLITGSSMFFGLVVKKFEESSFEYFVCQNCGSTLKPADLPKDTCPVCGGPASQYRKIAKYG
jgi:rubrerythrin